MTTETEIATETVARRPHRHRIAIGCAAIAVVTVTGTVWYLRSHAQAHSLASYPAYGNTISLDVGRTLFFGENLVDRRVLDDGDDAAARTLRLRIESVRAMPTRNTSGATVRLLRCTKKLPAGALASDRVDIDSRCSDLQAFSGGSITLGYEPGRDDIVMAVTPHHPGVVHIAGLHAEYFIGNHHGSQHVGAEITVTTTAD